MSKIYPDINLASDIWQTALVRINNLVDTLATEIITANSSSAGGLTIGNGYVSGIFGGTTIVANAITGGTVSISTVLSVASNTNYLPGSQFFAGNVTINALGWYVGGTNVSANSTALQVGNNTVNVAMNTTTVNVGPSGTLMAGNSSYQFTANIANVNFINAVTGTYITPAQIYLGNATSNLLINSTFAVFPALLFGGVGQNTVVNALGMFVANTLATANYGATGLVTGTSTVNNIAISVGANIFLNTTVLFLGNSTVNSISNSTIDTMSNSTVTSNYGIGSVAIGANVGVNTSVIAVGNTTVNLQVNSSSIKFSDGTIQTSAQPNLIFQTLTDAATIAVDMTTNINFNVQIAGNRTLGNPTNFQIGQSGIIKVQQDATGNRTLAYGANYFFDGDTAPTIGVTASKYNWLSWTASATNVILIS